MIISVAALPLRCRQNPAYKDAAQRSEGLRALFSLGQRRYNTRVKKLEILFGILRVPLDAIAVVLALLVAYRLRASAIDLVPGVQLLEPATTLPPVPAYIEGFVWPSVVIFLIAAGLLGLYSLRISNGAWWQAGRLLEAACLWLVLVMGWFFLVRKELFFSRVLLLHSTLFIFLVAGMLRALLLMVQRALLRMGFGVRAVVTVGRVPVALSVKRLLESDQHYRYVGHFGRHDDLRSVLSRTDIDLVLHTDPTPDDRDTLGLIEHCRSEHIDYAFFPPVLTESPHLLAVEHMGLLPLIRFRPTPLDGWGRVLKRGADVTGAAVLLVGLSPLLLLMAVAIVVDSGLPVFYVSRRVGLGGRRTIPVLKFRTMVHDADARKEELLTQNHRHDGPLFKMKDDPRVTRIGKVLRRWSLDEFPQLFNVLMGHMALVGPRPHLPQEVDRYSSFQRRVFAICPGMTGLAQISGRSDLTFEEEVRLDLQYIEEWSPLFDVWILWRTVFVILGRKGAD